MGFSWNCGRFDKLTECRDRKLDNITVPRVDVKIKKVHMRRPGEVNKQSQSNSFRACVDDT